MGALAHGDLDLDQNSILWKKSPFSISIQHTYLAGACIPRTARGAGLMAVGHPISISQVKVGCNTKSHRR